jgi:plasmid stability protein
VATLTIKNVPEALVRRFKAQAASRHRSLNSEVIACLETISEAAPLYSEALLARIRAVRRASARLRLTDRMLNRLKAEERP